MHSLLTKSHFLVSHELSDCIHAFKQAALSGTKCGAELAVPNPLAPSPAVRCAGAGCPDTMTQDSAWPQTSVPGAPAL